MLIIHLRRRMKITFGGKASLHEPNDQRLFSEISRGWARINMEILQPVATQPSGPKKTPVNPSSPP